MRTLAGGKEPASQRDCPVAVQTESQGGNLAEEAEKTSFLPALLSMGARGGRSEEWGRASNSTSDTDITTVQPLLMDSLQGPITGLSSLSVGALPTKTQGNTHALSLPVSRNQRGPWGLGGRKETGLEGPVLPASLGSVCHP